MAGDPLETNAALGVATMGREHELELRLVRELQAALGAGDRAAAEALFRSLEELTEAHFLGEQLLMRLHAYPAYAAHQEEHDRLIGELRNLAEAVASPDPPDPVAAAARLERWLHAHMQSEDAALADFLKRPAPEPI